MGRLYDIHSWKEGVEYGIFYDADGYAEGLIEGQVVDPFIKPTDIDVISKRITHIRWFDY